MTEEQKARAFEFLRLLNDATLKTGIAIAGCGCCGSPFLVETKDNVNAQADADAYKADVDGRDGILLREIRWLKD